MKDTELEKLTFITHKDILVHEERRPCRVLDLGQQLPEIESWISGNSYPRSKVLDLAGKWRTRTRGLASLGG